MRRIFSRFGMSFVLLLVILAFTLGAVKEASAASASITALQVCRNGTTVSFTLTHDMTGLVWARPMMRMHYQSGGAWLDLGQVVGTNIAFGTYSFTYTLTYATLAAGANVRVAVGLYVSDGTFTGYWDGDSRFTTVEDCAISTGGWGSSVRGFADVGPIISSDSPRLLAGVVHEFALGDGVSEWGYWNAEYGYTVLGWTWVGGGGALNFSVPEGGLITAEELRQIVEAMG